MAKTNASLELEKLSKALGELDLLRFAEEISVKDRIAIEKQMLALRASEQMCLQQITQDSFKKLETEINALTALRKSFEKKWKPISQTQAILDKLGKAIHSLLEVSKQIRNILQ